MLSIDLNKAFYLTLPTLFSQVLWVLFAPLACFGLKCLSDPVPGPRGGLEVYLVLTADMT